MERIRSAIGGKPKEGKAGSAIKTAPKNLESSATGISLPLQVEAVSSAFMTNFETATENRYVKYRNFLRMDPELNQAVTRLALLTQFAYRGILLRTDSTPTQEEKDLLQDAQDAAEEFDFRAKFFTHAKHCIRDGDSVFVAALASTIGIQQIQPLPMTMTTCVETESQIGKADAIIQQRKIYVVNEVKSASTQQTSQFPVDSQKNIVYHIAMDNEAEEIYDNIGRYTFGVWSESPIDCLKTQVLWKQAVKITDILWRYRNVPREVHKLDTSMFTPEKFQGENWEAQVTAAQTAAQAYLNAYAVLISNKKVDQGYIVGSNVVEISYVQPGGQRAGSPQSNSQNELIEQLNKSIREGVGAYSIGNGTYATELVTASYVILMPDWIAYKIRRALLDLLKRHLKLKYKYNDDLLKKLDIRLNLVLDILKGELARQIAILSASKAWTKDQLREMWGDQPLTKAEKTELEEEQTPAGPGRTSPVQTVDDLTANAERTSEGDPAPITPQSRADKQKT